MQGVVPTVVVFILALLAACFLGLGFVLQQHAAQRAPRADILSFRLLLDLAREPQWLAGIASMVLGQVLGAFALGRGDVSLVEPLLATNLLFALAFARLLTRQRLGTSGWSGVILLSLGVTAFIVAGQPRGAAGPPPTAGNWPVLVGVVGAAVLLVAIARRLAVGEQAALLAASAGVLFGLQDALTRVSLLRLNAGGFSALLLGWQPYVVVAIGLIGQVLVQSAFEAAPLRMSLPALTAAEPLAGIACGVGFLGDRLRLSDGAIAWEVLGLMGIVAGVVLLGRHPAMPCAKSVPSRRDEEIHTW